MSVTVMSWVFAHSKATGNDRLVLLAIADRCNDEGTEAWPSIPTLARKVLASERTVQRCLQNLEELGELEVARSPGGHASNRYRVRMDRGDRLSPRQIVTGDTPVTSAVTLVSSETSLRPIPPQPPASGGSVKSTHCEKHTRTRATCPACVEANRAARAKPPWCGHCDERTRLVENDGRPHRCYSCHPLTQSEETSA